MALSASAPASRGHTSRPGNKKRAGKIRPSMNLNQIFKIRFRQFLACTSIVGVVQLCIRLLRYKFR